VSPNTYYYLTQEIGKTNPAAYEKLMVISKTVSPTVYAQMVDRLQTTDSSLYSYLVQVAGGSSSTMYGVRTTALCAPRPQYDPAFCADIIFCPDDVDDIDCVDCIDALKIDTDDDGVLDACCEDGDIPVDVTDDGIADLCNEPTCEELVGLGYCRQDAYRNNGVSDMPQCASSADCGGEHCVFPCYDAAGNDYPTTECAITDIANTASVNITLPVGYTNSTATSICVTALGA
jgi:hypothetical protein